MSDTKRPLRPEGEGRRYRSEQRTQQAADTRAAIVAAARDLFATNGWAATSMRDIATHAGVALETIYASVGAKDRVLAAAMDDAIAGDAGNLPLAERPEVQALGTGTLADRITAAARLTTMGNARTIGLHKAFREAAASDPRLTHAYTDYVQRRRRDYRTALGLVAGHPLDPHDEDALWALLSRDIYELLVQHCDWTHQQYQDWTQKMITQALTTQVDDTSQPQP